MNHNYKPSDRYEEYKKNLREQADKLAKRCPRQEAEHDPVQRLIERIIEYSEIKAELKKLKKLG